MEKENKRHALVITSVLVLTLITVVGLSFAFFSASVNGNSQNISVQTGRLGSLHYTPLNNINLGNAAMPGTSKNDTFTVEYDGKGEDLTYDLEITINDDTFGKVFASKQSNIIQNKPQPMFTAAMDTEYYYNEPPQLILTLEGSTNKTNEPIDANSNILGIRGLLNTIPLTEGVNPAIEKTTTSKIVIDLSNGYFVKPAEVNEKTYKIIRRVRISEGEIHTYNVNLAFINYDSVDQNYNQGKIFNANLKISNEQVYNNSKQSIVLIDNCTDVGCEVAIGDEHFNIFSKNEEKGTVKLLAKYNLNVGFYCTVPNGEIGIQNQFARGTYVENIEEYMNCLEENDYNLTSCLDNKYYTLVGNTYCFNGSVPFDDVKQNISHVPPAKYDGSTIQRYVLDYENYLKSISGVNEITASLLTNDEITTTFEDYSGGEGIFSPRVGYRWMFNTSFWSRSAYSDYEAWGLYFDGSFEFINYDFDDSRGVRPIIEIPSFLI